MKSKTYNGSTSARSLLKQGPMTLPTTYRLRQRIGAGGMGEVYLAEHRGRAVAVKLLLPRLATDAGAVARLANEAAALSRINHENVVGLVAAGPNWLVMEHAGNRTLADVIADESPLPVDRAMALCDQVLAGLAAAHAVGVVHADLKSDNIMVEQLPDGSERVRLVDFGLARLMDAPSKPANRDSGSRPPLYGTPEYLAPELVLGSAASPASDVYAVGCLLHELLAGTTPFAGGTPVEVLQSHLKEDPEPVALRCPVRKVPVALEGVIARALEKRPDQRIATATQLREELAAAGNPSPRLASIRAAARRRRRRAA